jgi:hypothetical protein
VKLENSETLVGSRPKHVRKPLKADIWSALDSCFGWFNGKFPPIRVASILVVASLSPAFHPDRGLGSNIGIEPGCVRLRQPTRAASFPTQPSSEPLPSNRCPMISGVI